MQTGTTLVGRRPRYLEEINSVRFFKHNSLHRSAAAASEEDFSLGIKVETISGAREVENVHFIVTLILHIYIRS